MSSTRKAKILLSAIFFAGFFLGIVFFFPLNRIKSVLASQLSKQSGMDVEISNMSFGSGLSLGLSKGSLLGIHIGQLNVINPSGKSMACYDAVLAPHLINLFALQLKVGVSCNLDSPENGKNERGAVVAAVTLSPLYAPSKLSLAVDFDRLDLAPLMNMLGGRLPVHIDLSGKINGEFSLNNLALNNSEKGSTEAHFDLQFSQFLLASLELQDTPVFSTPLNLGETVLKGSLEEGKLSVPEFKFKSDELEGAMEMSFNMGNNGMLQSGLWTGKVKTLAASPPRDLSSVLELNFGPIDASGFREFKKKFDNGNFMALMNKPTE